MRFWSRRRTHPAPQAGPRTRLECGYHGDVSEQTQPGSHLHQAVDERTDRPPVAWLVLIVAVALAIRLVYLHQIEGIPFFYNLVSDAKGYDDWARQIAGGDWWGQTAFYQAPLYPYFLGLLKVIGADSLFVTRVVQALLGSLSCGLIGLAGTWFFSRRAGLWAGGILAVYPPAIFFDGLIQKTSLGQFLAAVLLVLLAWEHRRSHLAKLAAIGVVLGLFSLTRENALALVPVVAVWAVTSRRLQPARSTNRKSLLARLTLLLVGTAVVLVPVGLRNLCVGGEFALTTFQMGPNFFIGNNTDATGRYRPLVKGHETPQFERDDATRLAGEALGRRAEDLTLGEVSDYWSRLAWQYIRSRPADWIKLLGIKWLLVWNAYEIPDSEGYCVYAEWAWLLGGLASLVHFGVLVPLAAAGVVLTWSRRRELWLLYAMVLVTALAVTAFYVFARYRYPLVPMLVLFAGAGVAEALALVQLQRWKLAAAGLMAAGLTAIVVNVPVNPEGELDAMAWGNLGTALAQQGRIEPAVTCLERAVRGAPGAPEMRYNLGLAYVQQGRLAEAVTEFRTALDLAPGLMEVDYQLAAALERLGRRDEAVLHYRQALKRNPADVDAQAALRRLGATE